MPADDDWAGPVDTAVEVLTLATETTTVVPAGRD